MTLVNAAYGPAILSSLADILSSPMDFATFKVSICWLRSSTSVCVSLQIGVILEI